MGAGRRRYLWLGIGIGAVVGLGRNIQGNHYLSDVVFAFWMVYPCAILLAWRYELVIDDSCCRKPLRLLNGDAI